MTTMHGQITRFVSVAQAAWRHGFVRPTALALAAFALALPAAAGAQTLGTFRWQLQPYCNIVSLTVIQQGGQYTLDGTDDQCTAQQKASVRGMAFLNPNGTIGFGLTIVTTPGGAPVHVDATISMSTLSGTWTDSAGNDGTFVYTPALGVPGGSPRPATAGPQAEFRDSSTFTPLTSTPTVLRAVFVRTPAVGKVIANASGYFALRSTGQDLARCSISSSQLVDSTLETRADDFGNVQSQAFIPMALTRGFDVFPGSMVVYLVCEELAGAVEIRHTSLTAVFVAGPQ
jgi:hypothetical protein